MVSAYESGAESENDDEEISEEDNSNESENDNSSEKTENDNIINEQNEESKSIGSNRVENDENNSNHSAISIERKTVSLNLKVDMEVVTECIENSSDKQNEIKTSPSDQTSQNESIYSTNLVIINISFG